MEEQVVILNPIGNVSVRREKNYKERTVLTGRRTFAVISDCVYDYQITNEKKRTALLVSVKFDEVVKFEFEGNQYVVKDFTIDCYENVLEKIPNKNKSKRKSLSKQLLEQIKEKLEGPQEILLILRGKKGEKTGVQVKASLNTDGSLCVPVVILGNKDKVAKYDYHFSDLFVGNVNAERCED